MSTNQQRREAERRRLQRQLEERRAREASRKRFTLIASIVTTLVVIAAVVVVVVVATGGDKKKKTGSAAGAHSTSASATPSASASTSAPATPPTPPAPTAPCTTAGKKATATFHGISVGQATNLAHEPKVSGNGVGAVSNLLCEDLVVGKGKAASTSSTVTVQYTGVLFKDGKLFDSSWTRGQPAQFSLAQVVPGFTEGIGGAGAVAPMKVGGRRIMLLPPALGYGAQANGTIPANSTLVFVVDLKSIDG